MKELMACLLFLFAGVVILISVYVLSKDVDPGYDLWYGDEEDESQK